MKTTTYYNDKPLWPDGSARVDIDLIGTQRISIGAVLVDSGAHYVQIPLMFAQQAGIDLSDATPTNVSGVGGSTTMLLASGIDLEVEGCAIVADVLFDPNNGVALFGRSGLTKLDEHGFDSEDWNWNT